MGPKVLIRNKLHIARTTVIMRKYIRLSLFIFAFLCCSLMFVYHHKYSKLNVILQVMNAFSPRNTSVLNCHKKLQELSRAVRPDWTTVETVEGLPQWTEVFQNVHMYSTFWFGNSSNTLTFVSGLPVTDLESLWCRFTYDNGSLSEFIPTSSQLFRKKKNFLFFIVKCRAGSGTKVPHSVSFQLNKSPSIVSMQVASKQLPLGMLSMCVEPLPMGFNDIFRTIEFLVYHHHLGINHFLIYDNGISSAVKKLLLEFSPKSNIFVTLLPWNVPFLYDTASDRGSEYFVDCIHRVMTRNYSSFIVNTNINQFIVPKGVKNLTHLLSDEKLSADPPRFYEHKFCSEYADDTITHNLYIPFITLLKDKMLSGGDYVSSVIYGVQQMRDLLNTSFFKVLLWKDFPQKSAILPKHVAVLHSYQKCNESMDVLQKNVIVDKYLWKYKNLFFKSKLYFMAKQHHMFGER